MWSSAAVAHLLQFNMTSIQRWYFTFLGHLTLHRYFHKVNCRTQDFKIHEFQKFLLVEHQERQLLQFPHFYCIHFVFLLFLVLLVVSKYSLVYFGLWTHFRGEFIGLQRNCPFGLTKLSESELFSLYYLLPVICVDKQISRVPDQVISKCEVI